MIIIKIMGGLGNQMQQYALYRKYLSMGREAKLDLSWFDGTAQRSMLAPREMELKRFVGLPMEIAEESEVRKITGGSGLLGKITRKFKGKDSIFQESEMYHPEIFAEDFDNKLLEGYFACTKYYEDLLPQLSKDFAFPASLNPDIADENDNLCHRMMSDQEFSVAIHLRRGDYMDGANASLLGGICTPEYYAGAVRYIEEMVPDQTIRFYVFSDDPFYARECIFGNRGEEAEVIDWNQGSDSMLDIRLMNHCNAVIAANSTFSFWGGRLNVHRGTENEPILIRPLYHRNNQVPDPEKMHDYWKGWTLINREGQIC